jgi:2-oxoisovalerate dehydrogenase E2 component (dihydrolipoyl transacylase)
MPQVTMPQLGEGVEQGTIGKWLKAVGDHVRIGDPLVEVVTDKVNAEVPSPFEGTLTQILVAEGDTIPNERSSLRWSRWEASADALLTQPQSRRVVTGQCAEAASAGPSEEWRPRAGNGGYAADDTSARRPSRPRASMAPAATPVPARRGRRARPSPRLGLGGSASSGGYRRAQTHPQACGLVASSSSALIRRPSGRFRPRRRSLKRLNVCELSPG